MIGRNLGIKKSLLALGMAAFLQMPGYAVDELNISNSPLFLSQSQPPLNLLVMGRSHKLYYEAYNDASDLNDDDVLDVGYNPEITYFGYFDSYKCYAYQSGAKTFTPQSVTANKKCSGQWSGDFLNYLTTARIDALRKVLYGGYRSTDSTTQTVLERSFIPQDAHSWGKEYFGTEHDGYDIRDYTPLPLPVEGTETRHLFANTTRLNDANQEPLLRVLINSKHRIWEWVSIERAVADSQCNGPGNNSKTTCTEPAVPGEPARTEWQVVPAEAFSNLTQTTYDLRQGVGGGNDSSGDSINVAHPNNHAEYDNMVTNYALEAYKDGSGAVANIDGSGNPYGNNYDYLTIFEGQIIVPETDTYRFAVNGDDAVEVIIDGDFVAGWYGGHGANSSDASLDSHSGSKFLAAGNHTIEFRHEENWGGDSYQLYWEVEMPEVPAIPASTMTDYVVRTEVCNSSVGLESNCRAYGDAGSPVYKPIGLLQDYGETDRMLFGLLTGSYEKNTSGGVLRKVVESLSDEVDPDTGQFTNTVGIVKTIDSLRIANFGSGHDYDPGWPGAWVVDRPMNEGEFPDWGNPVAEMMYEGLRYFAGKASPTSDFNTSSGDDATLGLPVATWSDPYGTDNYKWCAKPFQTVISDINPSYDTDQLPGSTFDTITGDITNPTLDVGSLGQTIWNEEFGSQQTIFIGQSGGVQDGAPTPKLASSFGTIRGLSPEEPTKLGGYYAASVAYYGLSNDLNDVDGGLPDEGQKMTTFAVALASPLPRIDIPVNGEVITLVPFAKSVADSCGGLEIDGTEGDFQPTNTIVDFYVETLEADYGKFRINYEDVEQAADHDMDAIVEYEYRVNGDGTVDITLDSTYAAGCIMHHVGYVISGTTADGIYLEVRDVDTGAGADPDYFLDTPPGQPIGGVWADGTHLPLRTTRRFTPGNANPALLLKDPLWYAAKWGGFQDENDNNKPDLQEEWDEDLDGDPDNYFLVTNALGLQDQLEKAFEEILARTASASSASVNSGSINANTRVYQARFNSGTWSGELLSFPVEDDGSLGEAEWDAGEEMPDFDARAILTMGKDGDGIAFTWDTDKLSPAQQAALNADAYGNVDNRGQLRLEYLRGDEQKEEEHGGPFRTRVRTLGDIIHSEPEYVGGPEFFYRDTWPDGSPENGGQKYSDFREENENRTKMIYAGGNDGMLHGFNAATGVEEIAYVPGEVFAHLSALTSPDYSHRYYVDGPPTMGDAFFNSGPHAGKWQTVLVAGLGNGGQSVYALNINDPSGFTEANASNIVLWEFTSEDDPDLGYTYSQPAIVRMRNGKWAAVFGNGYNNTERDVNGDGVDDVDGDGNPLYSTTGNAVLYIVDIETGDIYKKLDTGVGTAQDPEPGSSRPNGLATVVPVDLNRDSVVDLIYAGDLFGNLWKFDVRSSDATQWNSAFVDAGDGTMLPLFVAMDSDGNRQPITSRPAVGRGPGSRDVMVLFGTGKYLESIDKDVPTDPVDQRVQSFYGIIDRNARVLGRADNMLKQEIIGEFVHTIDGNDMHIRLTSDNELIVPDDPDGRTPHKGWYIDLVSPSKGFEGERQVTNSLLRNGRVLFTTLIPSGDPCEFGGSGWLMGLETETGARVYEEEPLFDLNDDDDFTKEEDTIEITLDDGTKVKVAISGKASEVGIIPTPALLSNEDITHALTPGTTGAIQEHTVSFGPADFGRQSWQHLR